MNMKKLFYLFLLPIVAICLATACSDDDDFTLSTSALLTFSEDTIYVDTVFNNVSSATKSFWAYNNSGSGIRCTTVRLARGNQTGFRVNVNGTYLGSTAGYTVNDVEVRKQDSIRVFVELTSPINTEEVYKQIDDDIIFTLESGVEQRVHLRAISWKATLLTTLEITSDTTIQSTEPIVITKGLTIAKGATLTVGAGTTLYFGGNAGVDVYGTLVCEGTAENNVVLRGDRIDHMFDYLPYDRVSGQWKGVHIYAGSFNNKLTYTDIHSTYDGIVVDSTSISTVALTLDAATVHNCQGYGVQATHANIVLHNSVLSNTLNDCLLVDGGKAEIIHCTLAQFYPFDGNRGAALRFKATNSALEQLTTYNTLITGYADDVFMGEHGDETLSFNYTFDGCIIRTPKIETADSVYLKNTVYENVEDTIGSGQYHFKTFDTDNLIYDFDLSANSTAISKAQRSLMLPTDRKGRKRDDNPDVGAFEYTE